MVATPRRSAGSLHEPDGSRVRPARAAVRRRLRLGALMAGVAMLTAAGGAALVGPSATSEAVPAQAALSTAVPDPGPTGWPSLDPIALLRGDDRASRGDGSGREPIGSGSGDAAPAAAPEPPRIAGIPHPCPIDVPITADMTAAQITDRVGQQWGFHLTGPHWRHDDYRPVVQLFAETLDAVDCTDYLARVASGNGGPLEISSEPTRTGWAWGDYGLTRTKVLTLDLAKFRQGYADGDRGRLVRLIIHEMAHALNADRFSEPGYWQAYKGVWNSSGPVSTYGSTQTESFADAVGYYVARCATGNPYATAERSAYYDYVRSNIFGGREFGGPVGTAQHCAITGR